MGASQSTRRRRRRPCPRPIRGWRCVLSSSAATLWAVSLPRTPPHRAAQQPPPPPHPPAAQRAPTCSARRRAALIMISTHHEINVQKRRGISVTDSVLIMCAQGGTCIRLSGCQQPQGHGRGAAALLGPVPGPPQPPAPMQHLPARAPSRLAIKIDYRCQVGQPEVGHRIAAALR
jgi:hypothetical protein